MWDARIAFVLRQLDPDVFRALRDSAAHNQRSLRTESRAALRRATNLPRLDKPSAPAISDKWQRHLKGRSFPDTTELLREDRER